LDRSDHYPFLSADKSKGSYCFQILTGPHTAETADAEVEIENKQFPTPNCRQAGGPVLGDIPADPDELGYLS
jgi:hypothetical protein